jgi:hypothetical protein
MGVLLRNWGKALKNQRIPGQEIHGTKSDPNPPGQHPERQ